MPRPSSAHIANFGSVLFEGLIAADAAGDQATFEVIDQRVRAILRLGNRKSCAALSDGRPPEPSEAGASAGTELHGNCDRTNEDA